MGQLLFWPDTRIDELAATLSAKYRFGKFTWGLPLEGFDVETATYATIQPAHLADQWLWRYTCASMLCAHETLDHTIAACEVLFTRWPHWTALSAAPVDEVRAVLRRAHVARDEQKGPWLVTNAQAVEAWGRPPQTRRGLTSLLGVGNHVADIVRAYVFGDNVLAIDTHVTRIAERLGLSIAEVRGRTDLDLPGLSSGLVAFGKETCSHVAPKCDRCVVRLLCERTRT